MAFKPIPVGVVDWNNMVYIETHVCRYYVPVENSDEFIKQIQSLMKMNTLDEISKTENDSQS